MRQDQDMLAEHELAASWYMRRNAPGWSAVDERDFEAWLRAAPGRDQLYRQLGQTWQDLGELPRPRLASDAAPARQPGKSHAGARPRRVFQWRLAAFAMFLLTVGAGWMAYEKLPIYRLDVATGDEVRQLALPDGSRIAVNQHSALEVRLYAGRREIELARGEAFFEVSHNPGRPFTVLSGPSEVRVVGTVFDVRAGAPQLAVKVSQGRVEVRPDARRRDQVSILSANQGVELDGDQARRFDLPAEMVGDWRTGQLVFRATPLADVARSLSHYLQRPVRLADPALASVTVSGYVPTAAPRAFLESLPDLLAVKIRRDVDGGYLISAR